MKNSIRSLVLPGFLAVLALMFSLALISLAQLQTMNENMEKLVMVTSMKMAAANDMREAIRMRSDSLKIMRLLGDPLERDAEHQRFLGYAGKYRIARERFKDLGMDGRESAIHAQLRKLIRDARPFNEMAAELLMSDAPAAELGTAMKEASTRQGQLHEKLGELVGYERQSTLDALQSSRRHYLATRNLLFVLTSAAMLFSVLVAIAVTRRTAARNRKPAYQATHDPLTGLTNRREFEHRVERAIKQAKTHSTTHILMYLDLDRFKTINDTCGHAAGDILLKQLAQLMRSTVRNRDTLGRLGGDEFGLLLENCPLDRGVEVANNLRDAVDKFNFVQGNSTFKLGMSIGLLPLDHDTAGIAAAMGAADTACYIAKESGRNRVQIARLDNRRLQECCSEIQWKSRLASALQEDRLTLYFQPVIPCAGRRRQHRHIEIRVRMLENDGSVLLPDAFLPAAEKYDLATGIDCRVIEKVFAWLAGEANSVDLPVTVSVNLSGQTIGSREMMNLILEKTDETGISPEQVIFEINESAAIANITAVTGFMLTLRSRGFRFTLNDFGCGLSSFSYLKKLPVDFLKIDGVFVRDILCDPFDHAMVRSIRELGHLLGMEVIAQCVETLEVAEELRALGVNYAQGYAYARPEPLDTLSRPRQPRLVIVS